MTPIRDHDSQITRKLDKQEPYFQKFISIEDFSRKRNKLKDIS